MEKEKDSIISSTEHALCFQLTLSYLADILDNPPPGLLVTDFGQQVGKYEKSWTMGQSLSGRAWIQWFLKDFVPMYLKEENNDVSR